MAEAFLLPSAERDLEAIHRYTAVEWSDAQADRYISGLQQALTHIADFPGMGVEAAPGSGIRVWIYQRHRIVYCATSQGIEVSRIFHDARNIDLILAHYTAYA